MSETTAQELLDCYQSRLSMAEKGILRPKPKILEATKRLVSALSAMPADAKIRLEIQEEKAIFITANNGELLVEFDFSNEA